jgi:peptide/nickel transport system permease protein
MADEESIAEVRTALGLDRSLVEQFFIYVGNLLQGDLGLSLNTGLPVLEELLTRLPASLELTFTGLGMAILIAVPLGILAATRPGSWIDHLCRILVTAGVSLPTFFTGLFLIYVFYFLLGWAPSPLGRLDILYLSPPHVTGFYLVDSLLAGDMETFWAALRQLVLPAFTLGLFALAPIARMTRASMLTALGSDYVRTARANGLSHRKVLFT